MPLDKYTIQEWRRDSRGVPYRHIVADTWSEDLEAIKRQAKRRAKNNQSLVCVVDELLRVVYSTKGK